AKSAAMKLNLRSMKNANLRPFSAQRPEKKPVRLPKQKLKHNVPPLRLNLLRLHADQPNRQ
ncbi:MAG: hypothetical protein ACKVHL_10765, partial [Rhodospirillales bacterium]